MCGVGRVFLVGCPEPVLANHCFPWYYESSNYKSFVSTGDGLLSLSGRQDDIMPYNGTKYGCRFSSATKIQTKRAVFVVLLGRFGIDIYAQDENNDNAWRWFGTSGGAAQRANSHESFLGLRPLPGNKPRKYTVYFPTHIPVTSLQIGATPLLLPFCWSMRDPSLSRQT